MNRPKTHFGTAIVFFILIIGLALCQLLVLGATKDISNPPHKMQSEKNPYQGKPDAVEAGKKLFSQHCAECHGNNAHGKGKAPALASERIQSASNGALFWFIRQGNMGKGMPSWSRLPAAQVWQIITFVKSLPAARARE